MDVALRFAYDGSRFDSYARQPDYNTVEDTLIEVLRTEGYVDGSWRTGSRTDRGVSALENVAKCSLDRRHLRGFVPAMNGRLVPGLWVTGVAQVDAAWNPRHGRLRTYQYLQPKAGEDLARLSAACDAFVGTHQMHGFARIDARNPERTITAFDVADHDAWLFSVQGPSFLWNQVRRMVAAVLDVGRGKLQVADITRALQTGEVISQVAKPEGLLLAGVRYEPEPPWEDTGPGPHVARQWQQAQARAHLLDQLSALYGDPGRN